MISRIFSEILENSSYPLVDSSVYPKGLITSITITLNEYHDVFIDYFTTSDNTAYMLFSYVDGSYKKPLGYGTSDIRTNDTIDIISESTGKPIGFVILGSLAYDNSTYCGSVQVLKSCIRISSLPESTFEINGNKYNMPRDLNILISGYLDISNGYIYNKFPESGDLLDSSSVVLDGGINSVNGVVGRGSIVIDMPVGSRSDVPLFKIDVDNTYTNGYTSITIGTNPEANLEDISMFTCPDSDILLDKIVGDGLDIDDVESPLDAFVAWYKHKSEEESNSGS